MINNLDPDSIHSIVCLAFRYKALLWDITQITGQCSEDVIEVIQQEKRNIIEARNLRVARFWKHNYARGVLDIMVTDFDTADWIIQLQQ